MQTTFIGIFGKRNTGKSSLINLLVGQSVAIVSATPGTTTDPIKKGIEIFGIGACRFVDTAGIDDEGQLGQQRVEKTQEIVSQVDIAIILFSNNDFGNAERELFAQLEKLDVPIVLVHNRSDVTPLNEALAKSLYDEYRLTPIAFSCKGIVSQQHSANYSTNQKTIFDALRKAYSRCNYRNRLMFDNLVSADDRVLLVCPQDAEAPTGRLILPQVMAIRELIDKMALVTVIQPESLEKALAECRYSLVVTDSSVFDSVASTVAEEIPLTSFSMLLARSKGCFEYYLKGTPHIAQLCDGDKIMILESCTHPSSCEDIGRVKLPALFRKFTGKDLSFTIVAGLDKIPENISEYALVVQCGGCVITARQLYSRLYPAISAKVAVTNYGMAIAFMNGIYERAIKLFQ